jgi:hypothetical protein
VTIEEKARTFIRSCRKWREKAQAAAQDDKGHYILWSHFLISCAFNSIMIMKRERARCEREIKDETLFFEIEIFLLFSASGQKNCCAV